MINLTPFLSHLINVLLLLLLHSQLCLWGSPLLVRQFLFFNPFAFITVETAWLHFTPRVRSAWNWLASAKEFSHINNYVLTTVPPQKAGQAKAGMSACQTAAAQDVWPGSFMSVCSGTDPFLFHSHEARGKIEILSTTHRWTWSQFFSVNQYVWRKKKIESDAD